MKIKILHALIILLVISCSKKSALDGVWYVESLSIEGEPIVLRECQLYIVKGDSAISLISSRYTYSNDTVLFKHEDSTLTIDSTNYTYKFSGDSIILISRDESSETAILKRMGEHRKIPPINKDYFLGPHGYGRINYDEAVYNIDFQADSTLTSDEDKCTDYPYGKWWILNYDGFQFLCVPGSIPLVIIQSCEEEQIILSSPLNEENRVVLKKINRKIEYEELVGKWYATEESNATKIQLHNQTNEEPYQIIIDEDSINFISENHKNKWLISVKGDFIYFPENNWFKSLDYGWQIIEFTPNKLKVKYYLDVNIEQTIVFEK